MAGPAASPSRRSRGRPAHVRRDAGVHRPEVVAGAAPARASARACCHSGGWISTSPEPRTVTERVAGRVPARALDVPAGVRPDGSGASGAGAARGRARRRARGRARGRRAARGSGCGDGQQQPGAGAAAGGRDCRPGPDGGLPAGGRRAVGGELGRRGGLAPAREQVIAATMPAWSSTSPRASGSAAARPAGVSRPRCSRASSSPLMNASPAPTVSTTSHGHRARLTCPAARKGEDAVTATGDDDDLGPAREPVARRRSRPGRRRVEVGEVLVAGLDQMGERERALDLGPRAAGVRLQVGTDVRVVGDGSPGRSQRADPAGDRGVAGRQPRGERAEVHGARRRPGRRELGVGPAEVGRAVDPEAVLGDAVGGQLDERDGRGLVARRRTATGRRRSAARACAARCRAGRATAARRRRPAGRAGPARARRCTGCRRDGPGAARRHRPRRDRSAPRR